MQFFRIFFLSLTGNWFNRKLVIYDASLLFQVLTEQVLFLQEKSFIFARPQFLLPAERNSKHQLSKTCIQSVKANAYIFISVSIYYKWKHLPFPLKLSLPLPPPPLQFHKSFCWPCIRSQWCTQICWWKPLHIALKYIKNYRQS